MVRNLHATTWCFAGAVQGKMNTASHQLFLSACLHHRGEALKWKQKQMESVTPAHPYPTSDSHFLHDFPRIFTHFSFSVKLKSTRTETITSTMRQTVAFGFMFTYCDAQGGWVAIGTFVATHPSEKVPILCNTRYIRKSSCMSE